MTGPAPTDGPAWYRDGYRHIWLPYTQMKTSPPALPVAGSRGSRIVLEDGRELIDGIASWWSACHGYNHPHIRDAVTRQAENMPHVMLAGLANEPAFTLARRLAGLAPGDLNRVFFSESGSVSVELAMKMAVQAWINRGDTKRTKFIHFRGGYHGDTIGTMGVGDPDNIIHGPFSGLMSEQIAADLPTDAEARERFEALVAETASRAAAVIMEPLVQGAGGMRFHEAETVRFVRQVCDAHGLLLILDEIMVGFRRLGPMFACEACGVVPDIMTLSKSLTGGTMALAATIATDRLFELFYDDEITRCLMHGPTYTGNALACAAANASLDLFEREPREAQVVAIAEHLESALEPCRDVDGVVDVRVRGALGVVELASLGSVEDMYWIRRRFVEEGCWVRPFGNVVYLMPAFTMSPEDLAHLTRTVVALTEEWSRRRASAGG